MELIFTLSILVSAIPMGIFLRYLTYDEIEFGKPYFKILTITFLFIFFISIFLPLNLINKKTLAYSSLYFSIVSFISFYNKNMIKLNGKKKSTSSVKSSKKIK